MTTHPPISKATDSPLLVGEGLGVRFFQFLKAAAISMEKVVEMMKLTKRQFEATMFACGAENLESLKIRKLNRKQEWFQLEKERL